MVIQVWDRSHIDAAPLLLKPRLTPWRRGFEMITDRLAGLLAQFDLINAA
jgi:hypothetical protein